MESVIAFIITAIIVLFFAGLILAGLLIIAIPILFVLVGIAKLVSGK